MFCQVWPISAKKKFKMLRKNYRRTTGDLKSLLGCLLVTERFPIPYFRLLHWKLHFLKLWSSENELDVSYFANLSIHDWSVATWGFSYTIIREDEDTNITFSSNITYVRSVRAVWNSSVACSVVLCVLLRR